MPVSVLQRVWALSRLWCDPVCGFRTLQLRLSERLGQVAAIEKSFGLDNQQSGCLTVILIVLSVSGIILSAA